MSCPSESLPGLLVYTTEPCRIGWRVTARADGLPAVEVYARTRDVAEEDATAALTRLSCARARRGRPVDLSTYGITVEAA
ncbi:MULTISPECIES: hypothetical protein [Myxococcus]|uniref:hypothetical protein n=1 Tax=Myxococcus TaxID=32 RepID=UPI001144EBF9|nr:MULTISPECIES: hypothetical protein [Myxococcus]NOK06218.1 hypothetical protein [Myxococcus xanthus]